MYNTSDRFAETPPQALPRWNPILAVIGFLLTLPAFYRLFVTLIQPVQQVIEWSGQKVDVLKHTNDAVGTLNFDNVFKDANFNRALTFTLSLVAVRVLVAVILPPFLGWALSQLGRSLRMAVRLFLFLPLVFFAPVATAISWSLALNPQFGLLHGSSSLLASVESAPNTLRLIDGLFSIGIAFAFGAVVYVMALRPLGGDRERRGVWKGFIVVWLASAAVAAASALQSFVFVFVLTNGGPASSTLTLTLELYRRTFQNFQFGPGAVVSVVMLAVLAVLGLIVTLVVLFTNVAIADVAHRRVYLHGQGLAFIVLVLTFLIALAVVGINLAVLIWAYQNGQPVANLGDLVNDAAFARTVVPPLLAVLSQLPIIYFAALGIGALRPFQRFSEVILLVFSPFLFVTMMPLSAAYFNTVRDAGLLNTTYSLGYPGEMLNIGALFILTLFFKGQSAVWNRARYPGVGGFLRCVILPSIPLVLLLTAIAAGIAIQDGFWPLIAVNASATYPLTVTLEQTLRGGISGSQKIGSLMAAAELPFHAVYFLLTLIFSLFYLDRLAIGSRKDLTEEVHHIREREAQQT